MLASSFVLPRERLDQPSYHHHHSKLLPTALLSCEKVARTGEGALKKEGSVRCTAGTG